MAFDIQRGPDRAWTAKPAWESGLQGYMCTPVVLAGHAYLLVRNQRLSCIDLRTGKQTWPERKRFGQYMSLISNGKVILGLDQRGQLVLFRANPAKFELLDRRDVAKQQTWAHLAMAGDRLFIRELKAISCWRWAAAEQP